MGTSVKQSTAVSSLLYSVAAWENVKLGLHANVVLVWIFQQLQSKYDNLKTEARKVLATQRMRLNGTTVGPFNEINDDSIFLALLELLTEATVIGFPSKFDTDACYVEEERSVC